MASLHLRTIEALALAIDAKDHSTHEHLQRVRVYAVGSPRNWSDERPRSRPCARPRCCTISASWPVPEHILNKPGKLTPEEFEKMKVHPLVGAEILERVQFPYAVAPIVRAHHEKWDGTGYPDGLKGEQISQVRGFCRWLTTSTP